MYLYTARFSRRHVTVSGALVWEKIQTLESSLLSWVTAGCLSRGGRRDYLSERGLSHRVLYLKCILPLRKATVWRDTNQKKNSDSTLFWLSEIDVNEQIPLHVTAACEMERAEASTWGEKRKDRWRRQSLAAGPGAVTELDRWRVWKQGRGRRVLTAGQAAHFTVLSAGLVHEGTVEAGPHGGGGGRNRGAAHGPVIQRAGGLPTHCTWKDSREKTGYYHSEE